MQETAQQASGHEFEEISHSTPENSNHHLRLEDLKNVPLEVTAELGRCSMLVRDVLSLHVGSVIPLNKQAGEMTDIYVRNMPLGRGEIVVLADMLHVRISEIHGTGERSEGESNVG